MNQPHVSIYPLCHLKASSRVPCVIYSRFSLIIYFIYIMGSPHSSVSKESTCNAGDRSSISGLGRFTGEGIGYPLQHSRASLVVQLVKNPPAMWETWVYSTVYVSIQIPQFFPPLFSPLCPYVCSLYMCLYFCFANRFTKSSLMIFSYIMLISSFWFLWNYCMFLVCNCLIFQVH